ncbi:MULTISPECIES: hypothetical protein [unclassified Mucilaginibacter]|mgnify:CR=1 FL=1|uniref:hypothetical protein n=1 Tax=unclassified Mucilaginibacter TaxID=2617802 RepID=UPI000965B706|nr:MULTISPECIES: hypothetical protein [unclassified Mucilaginibacter]OJW12613.1 MAG: hypothetical protein BGO48_05890 [Mucilaginibacter sp. 44-25]PLW90484.1 MAG: hypothetical protein C0154_06145 [Mucilaginibacter sp.]HEK19492.1 hypothetical protein [Bacteroidota bacterium]
MELIFNKQMVKPAINKGKEVICPGCGKNSCERIRRGTLVRALLPWLNVKRYHCQACLKHFYKLKN